MRKFIVILFIMSSFLYAQSYSKNHALKFYNEGKIQNALDEINSVLLNNPMDDLAYQIRAGINTKIGNYAQALEDINISIKLAPYSIKYYFDRGQIYCIMSEYDKALEDANFVITKSPDFPDVYNQRGYIYLMKEEYLNAKSDFDKAISNICFMKGNDYHVFYSNRASANLFLGNYDEALSDINQALKLFSDNPNNYLFKIIILKKLNEQKEIDDCLNYALSKFPENINLLLFDFSISMEKVDFERIQTDISRLKELKCDTLFYHKLLKIYYLLINDNDNYNKEIEILNNPEKLTKSFDIKIFMTIDPISFLEKYNTFDKDIELLEK